MEEVEQIAELTEEQIDALFSHLEELMPQLQTAVDNDERIAAAKRAAQCAPAQEEYRKAKVLLDAQLEKLQEEKEAFRAARAAGDTNGEGVHALFIKRTGEQIDFAKAPVERAKANLNAVAKQAGFKNWDEAEAAMLTDEQIAELQKQSEDIRSDYAKTFNECQKYAGEEEE